MLVKFNQIQYYTFRQNQTNMSQQQTLLRTLLTKVASQVFPSLKQPISIMKKYEQFQNQLINKIKHIRDNTKIFEEEAKVLREQFEDMFELLDKEIEHSISKLTQKQMKKQIVRSQSLLMPEQKRTDKKKRIQNVSYKKQNFDSKLAQKRHLEHQISNQPQKSLQLQQNKQRQVQNKDEQPINESLIKTRKKGLDHKNLTFLSKQDRKPIQIYCCFICYKSNEKHFMWQRQKQYLDHLKDFHQIVPEFEYILEFFQNQIMLSHAFFKGRLVNLMKNSISKDLLFTVYLLHKQRYEQLYFCGCRDLRKKKKFSIFSSQQQFYEHIKGHTKQKIRDNYSHFLTTNGQFVSFTRNKKFNFEQVEDFFNSIIIKIKQYFLETIDNFCYQKLLHFNPLNNLQLVSCSKKIKQQLSISNIYNPIPYCTNCDKFEENWNLVMAKHSGQNKCTKSGSYEYSLDKIKDFMQKTQDYKKHQLPEIGDQNVTKEELQILKAQVRLMKSSDFHNKCYKICAECERVFKQKYPKNYIKHIYLQHPRINPLNNYEFSFILESNLPQQIDEHEV